MPKDMQPNLSVMFTGLVGGPHDGGTIAVPSYMPRSVFLPRGYIDVHGKYFQEPPWSKHPMEGFSVEYAYSPRKGMYIFIRYVAV
jgi:hypothetical protein